MHRFSKWLLRVATGSTRGKKVTGMSVMMQVAPVRRERGWVSGSLGVRAAAPPVRAGTLGALRGWAALHERAESGALCGRAALHERADGLSLGEGAGTLHVRAGALHVRIGARRGRAGAFALV